MRTALFAIALSKLCFRRDCGRPSFPPFGRRALRIVSAPGGRGASAGRRRGRLLPSSRLRRRLLPRRRRRCGRRQRCRALSRMWPYFLSRVSSRYCCEVSATADASTRETVNAGKRVFAYNLLNCKAGKFRKIVRITKS